MIRSTHPEDVLLLVNAAVSVLVLVVTAFQIPRLRRLGAGRWVLWTGCSILVAGVGYGNLVRFYDWSPVVTRLMVLVGMLTIIAGYLIDAREFKQGRDRL